MLLLEQCLSLTVVQGWLKEDRQKQEASARHLGVPGWHHQLQVVAEVVYREDSPVADLQHSLLSTRP